MFTLVKEPRWIWPVKVQYPTDDGRFEEKQFRCLWRLVPEERRRELDASPTGTDTLLREAVVELLDLQDEGKSPLRHSPELLEAVIAQPWIRVAMVRSYVEALMGTPSEAASGN